MIKLRNIVKNNDSIACDAYVEDCETSVRLSMDIGTGELNSFSLPNEYSWCASHIAHAKKYLYSLINVSNVPKEHCIMWY